MSELCGPNPQPTDGEHSFQKLGSSQANLLEEFNANFTDKVGGTGACTSNGDGGSSSRGETADPEYHKRRKVSAASFFGASSGEDSEEEEQEQAPGSQG